MNETNLEKKPKRARKRTRTDVFHIFLRSLASEYNVFVCAWRMISCWTSIKRSHLSDHFVTDFLWIWTVAQRIKINVNRHTHTLTEFVLISAEEGAIVSFRINFFPYHNHYATPRKWWAFDFAYMLLLETDFQQLIKWKWYIPPSISKLYELMTWPTFEQKLKQAGEQYKL